MDAFSEIESRIRDKYEKAAMPRKATGDFMMSETHAVNIKSNNVDKQNYSPNMVSIRVMHKWVFENRCDLSFIFVDYRERNGNLEVIRETEPIPIEQISWDCLSIEAQGYGVIQMCRPRKILPQQTKRQFYKGFLRAYDTYLEKEKKKHENFKKKFIDPKTINW